jgi:hypothetical protein
MELALRVSICLLLFLCLYELSSCSGRLLSMADQQCAKCGADAPMWADFDARTSQVADEHRGAAETVGGDKVPKPSTTAL